MSNNNHLLKQPVTLLFVLLASVFVFSTLVKPYPLSWAVKLLPMILLIGLAVRQLGFAQENKYFIVGLIFSACGDFILDYNRQGWFIFGLAAFFIAHLFYLSSLQPRLKKLLELKILTLAVIYLSFGIAMLILLADGLGTMFIPVLAYMAVLLFMAIATILSNKANIWLTVGGISFVLSDSLIGFDKFYLPIEHSHFFVMISYYFAQFALLKGMLKSTRVIDN